MIVLSDTDIVLKLAACQLLHELPDLLDVPSSDVRVLNALRFQLRKQERLKALYTPEGVQRALDFVDEAGELSEASDGEYEALLQVEGIDTGEAVLFAQTQHFSDFLLLTGDKRSLEALVEAANLDDTKTRLAGRVCCFEQLVLRFIDALSFETVCRRVAPARNCDTVLEMAFFDGVDSERERVVRYLESYTPNLHVGSEPLLAELA